MSKKESVGLASLDQAAKRLHEAHNAAGGKKRDAYAEAHGNLAEARAAFAELIASATAVNALSIQSEAHMRLRLALRRVAANARIEPGRSE